MRRPQTEPPWSEGLDYSPVPHHETAWDVFDPRGIWSATVVLPARFRLMAVSADALAGVAKDDLDVERVQVWGVRRGS